MRREFGKFMVDIAEKDDKVFLIIGDIGFGIFDEYRKRFPNRFINIGICEQSMIGIAAGMALQGLKPYVYTITPFLIERPFEQIKIDIDINNVNVKLIGYDDYPTQGPTHDINNIETLMKHFKNIKSFFPSNQKETREMLTKMYNTISPCFIRLKRSK